MREKITVIGVGRLGICLALCLEEAGYDVLGVDVDTHSVKQINEKTLHSFEPGVSQSLQRSRFFQATTSLEKGLLFSDLCFLVVPTNSIPDLTTYDHTILSDLLVSINRLAPVRKQIIICSTVFPGYCSQTAKKLLGDCPKVSISYNPEFIAQGSILKGLKRPDLVLIGEENQDVGRRLASLYKRICSNNPIIKRMSVESAEIAKLAINCFITKKIAFANLISAIAEKTRGANQQEILDAVGSDTRIGSKCLHAGYGFGGPCFPRDNEALGNYASFIGLDPQFIRSTDLANEQHAEWMTQQLLKEHCSEYLFEDVSYKSNCPVPIIERSQKLEVAKRLAKRGQSVVICDSQEVLDQVSKEFGSIFIYRVKNLGDEL